MGSAYEDIIGSDIFTFVVGPNGKEYNVHTTAVSSLSKPLGVLINGEMREPKEKRLEWPDIDEKTFVRFVQWAYTKTYVTEEPDIILNPSLIGSPEPRTIPSALPEDMAPESPLYSLNTARLSQDQMRHAAVTTHVDAQLAPSSATLKAFTLYPSRMGDIAALAKYVFENTVPDDKIRDMVTL